NESGPQVQQASNAYRLSLPEKALRFLGRLGKAPPPPDDHVQAESGRKAYIEEHKASLGIEERVLFDLGDNPLGLALARLGKSLQQRESAKQTESPSNLIHYENNVSGRQQPSYFPHSEVTPEPNH